MRQRSDLHKYQERAIDFIEETKRCALFLSMGLGKSAITLTAISDLQDQMLVHKVLVIAPLRVANSVWDHEVKLWRHLKHLKVQISTGTERERLTALHRDADIYTINRENVPWLVKQYGKKWPFDMVVIDESDSFKSASSIRFKALKKILPFTNYRVLLTGTPSPNGLLDLWSQIYLLDQGVAIGRTMSVYKQRFFEADYMGFKYTPRAGADAQIHAAIQHMVLSMRAEDYLELPERIDLTEFVDLPPKIKEAYDDFERKMLIEFETGEVVEALGAAVLANKLSQFCICEGTDVLTNNGWKPIETLHVNDLIWDGVEWANYSELVCNGYKDVIVLDGVKMTPEHKVLTVSGWESAEDILNGNASKRFNRVDVWIPDRFRTKGINKKQKRHMVMSMYLWEQYSCKSVDKYSNWNDDSGTSCKVLQNKISNITCEDISLQMGGVTMVQTTNQEKRKVYDVIDCGKRNRFVVRGVDKELLIVHNCNGASYTDTHKNWVEIHSVKLDALAEIIEHNAGENILVAYNFKTDLERLQNKFPQAQVLDKNPNTIARWNEGHIPLLLAHPASAAHGINAQHGGAIVVWFGLNWSLGLYQQFNARLHRQGQTRPVRIVHIVARDTIDERIITALAAKDVTQSDLLKALMYKES